MDHRYSRAAVIAVFLVRRFQNERLCAQFRMGQDAAEPFRADVSFANIGMAVDVGSHGSFGIVGVHHVYMLKAQRRADLTRGLAQASFTSCGVPGSRTRLTSRRPTS